MLRIYRKVDYHSKRNEFEVIFKIYENECCLILSYDFVSRFKEIGLNFDYNNNEFYFFSKNTEEIEITSIGFIEIVKDIMKEIEAKRNIAKNLTKDIYKTEMEG